jgi:RHS repeat-associated protein
LPANGQDGTGLLYRRNRYYDPASGRFTQEDPLGLAGGLNLYGFADGDPVNFADPIGLEKCKNDDFWCNFRRSGWQMLGTLVGFLGGSQTGGALGLACGPAAEVCVPAGAAIGGATGAMAGYAASTMAFDNADGYGGGGDATSHGSERLSDPSRLNAEETADVVQNATQQFVQKDAANVWVKQVGDRFSVVVKNAQGRLITNFKTLDQQALNRLAKNYGWQPH